MHRAEARGKKLRESEGRLRQLADAMPQMSWIASPDGTPEYFNQRWEAFVGETSHDPNSSAAVVHPEDLDRSSLLWKDCIRRGEPFAIEYRFFDKKDKTYRGFWGARILFTTLMVKPSAGLAPARTSMISSVLKSNPSVQCASSEDQARGDVLASGYDEFLLKTADFDPILAVLDRMLFTESDI